MRASADRPLSALIAILATVLLFALLAVFLQRQGDDGLAAVAGDPPPVVAPAQ